MKKMILGLIISFSLVLIGCSQAQGSLSVLEAMNKDLIQDIKDESREIMAKEASVELVEAGLNKTSQDLEIKFRLDQEQDQDQLEELSRLIVEKIKYRLGSLNPRVTIAWDYKDGEKLIFYSYRIEADMELLLEENYLEEKN